MQIARWFDEAYTNFDLDFIFCVCNAAGLSAYHFIERRMAPLSATLAGVVLPLASFGTHLDDQGNTIDPELEIEKAGEILCEIWGNTTIMGIQSHAITDHLQMKVERSIHLLMNGLSSTSASLDTVFRL